MPLTVLEKLSGEMEQTFTLRNLGQNGTEPEAPWGSNVPSTFPTKLVTRTPTSLPRTRPKRDTCRSATTVHQSVDYSIIKHSVPASYLHIHVHKFWGVQSLVVLSKQVLEESAFGKRSIFLTH